MDGRPGPKAAGVAKREDSYGPKSGPNAGSRASSPGEQAAACDCQITRALGRGLNSRPQLATTEKLVSWALLRFSHISSLRELGGDGPRYGEAEGTFLWDEPHQAGGGEDQELVRFVADDQL